MRQPDYARRKARGGRGLLPPNPSQWGNEHNALDVRDELGLTIDQRLSHEAAFDLEPNTIVVPHGELPAAAKYLDHFRQGRAAKWSGMVITLPTGNELVLFNDSHPITRIRATLMEEFFHLRLGHPRSALRIYGDNGSWRTYEPTVEQEAYGSGAAALVPFAALRPMIEAGRTVRQIAQHFEVSDDLVLFRCKVTKTYRSARRKR